MKNRMPRILLLMLIAVLTATSCRDKLSTEDHPYILAYTSGHIPANAPVMITFSDDAPMLAEHSPGDEVAPGALKFSPRVRGKGVWVDWHTLSFTPDKPLVYDKHYRVSVNMSCLMKTGDTPKKFVFEVIAVKPGFSVYNRGLTMYDESLPNVYYLSGIISSDCYVAPEDVEKMLTVNSPQRHEVSWTHDNSGTAHNFTIDSLRSAKEPYDVNITVSGKHIGSDFLYEETVNVPEAGVFKLLGATVEYAPEFRAVVTFSSPIADKQRLGDFFRFSEDLNCRYASQLNKVYIYPLSRIVGTYDLTIEKGLLNTAGDKLAESQTLSITFDEIEPSVKFIGTGSIMVSANNFRMPFRAVNFAEVEVKVLRIFQNNILQFLQENSLSDGGYELYRVGREVARTTIKLGDPKSEKLRNWNTYSLDIASLVKAEPGAIYRVMMRGRSPLIDKESDDDDYDYDNDYSFGPYRTREDRIRNILASDIGIIAKADDSRNITVYITNLISAAPEQWASVKVYDFVNQLIGSGQSGADGMAHIPLSGEPHVVVVEKNNQWSYLRVVDGANLSVSEFDVSGQKVEGGLKGFIYGERGVWRPGDDIYLTFVLMDRQKILPRNHPVKLELADPNGQSVITQVKTGGENGIYAFTLKTDPDAITGVYVAKISVGNSHFTKSLRIETIKPNRLKIDFTLNDIPVLDIENIRGRIFSEWLTGARAPGLETRVEMTLSQIPTTFPGYDKYVFDDRTKRFSSEDYQLFTGKLDENGVVNFTESVSGGKSAPGMLSAKFTVRVFENSGDFSIDQYTTKVSPFPVFVGLSIPPSADKYWDMIETEKDQTFGIALLTPGGKPAAGRTLKVEVFRIDWSWWWNLSRDGYANYSSDRYSVPVFEKTITVPDGKGSFTYKWDRGDWGTYMIKVTDPQGGHSASRMCYVDWSGGGHSPEGDATGATMLTITTDKPSYKVGDKAKLTFPSAAGARALLTVESGSRVLSSKWYDLGEVSTTITLDVTSGMTPNVYAFISQIQPYSRTLNDAPMRLYGVVPLMVEDAATKLEPVIDVPKELRPEKPFAVKVRESNGRAMSYTIAIVDEGLLSLTRFKTPNPWAHFFAREALGIKTWDLYDNIIGAYAGRIEQLFAIGGDDQIIAKGDVKAQRFKPVVKFMGPFTLAKGKTAVHDITLPPYVGQVRTMVVAASEETAYGSAEAQSIVRKPLMIVTTMPRVISTDEDIEVPVTVFAMDGTVRDVSLKVTETVGFSVSGSQTRSVSFTAPGDKITFFKLRSAGSTGAGKLTVTATSSDDKATETIDIEIRDPNPRNITSLTEIVEKGATYTGKFALAGRKGTNTCVLEVSSIPPLNLSQRLDFLINYPHGCLEQITSSIFPQLYLARVADLDRPTILKTEANIKAAIAKFNNFRTSSGAFNYWPGGSTYSSWADTYAGHFLIEARKMGYAVPADMMTNWMNNQTKMAREWSNSDGNAEGQAYRLYVIALGGSAERGAMNRLKENATLTPLASWMLAWAYTLDGKSDVAHSIISNLSYDTPASRWRTENFGDSDRDMAVIVTVLNLLKLDAKALPLAMKLSQSLNSSKWMSTQSCAWALMALSGYSQKGETDAKHTFDYSVAGVKGSDKLVKSVREIPLDVKDTSGEVPVSIRNMGTSRIYVRLTSHGIPEKGKETARSENLSLTVTYRTTSGAELDVSKLKLGTDFVAEAVIKNTGSTGTYTNLILSQIFPSGWEIRDSRAVNGSRITFKDQRDDRVYSYFDLPMGASIVIRTDLTTTYAGRFYLPGTVSEAMYDGSIYSSIVGKWCEVER